MRKSLLLVVLLGACVSTTDSDEMNAEFPDLAIGLHERNDRQELKSLIGVDPVRTEWCAAYVDYVLELNGLNGTDSLLAKSYLGWGIQVQEPELWDVVIFDRGREAWQGHVGFYMGSFTRNGQVFYMILGGNQSDAVTIEAYPRNKVQGIRRWLE